MAATGRCEYISSNQYPQPTDCPHLGRHESGFDSLLGTYEKGIAKCHRKCGSRSDAYGHPRLRTPHPLGSLQRGIVVDDMPE